MRVLLLVVMREVLRRLQGLGEWQVGAADRLQMLKQELRRSSDLLLVLSMQHCRGLSHGQLWAQLI